MQGYEAEAGIIAGLIIAGIILLVVRRIQKAKERTGSGSSGGGVGKPPTHRK